MRRLVPLALVLIALLAPASALGASAPVSINASDPVYTPATVTISPSDSVVWTHNEGLMPEHGVQFDDQSASAATCTALDAPGSTCSRSFPAAGRYFYMDPATCTSGPASACAVHGEIVVYVPPTAEFSATPNPLDRGGTVNFDASASTAPGGSIASYSWDFGDGSPQQTGQPTSHAYSSAGTFPAKLTIIDDQGNAAIQIHDVTVNVPDGDGDGVNDDNDQCPGIPAPGQPNGCPPPPDITTATTAAKTLGLQGTVKSGITVVVSCSDTCSAALTVLPLTQAAALAAPLASGSVSIPGGGSQVVTLTFTAPAKKALAKLKNPQLRLQVVVTDALGRVQSRVSSITLKTVKTLGRTPAIGISDQQPTTFVDPLFQILRLKYARYVTPWNSITKEPARLDAWLQAARAQGVRPLVSFEHARGDLCPKKPCRPPSKAQYAKAWKAFHKKYSWVKDISPWNEANSATQPTGKRPDLAAAYYNVVRAGCRGCTIVAADVLDLNNLRRYLAAFLLKAKGKPRLWGLHNYRDTNRFRQTGTRQLLKAVKGQIWFTETGGIVQFTTQGGKKALPKSESRAKKAMDYVFRLAALDFKRVKRVYVYQWKVNFAGDRFDAGVVRPDGTPRPSFDVLTLNASIARKR